MGRATTIAGICEIHKRFSDLLPEALLATKSTASDKLIKITPGQLRTQDVKVGQHIAISPGALPQFIKHFAKIYTPLGKAETIMGLLDFVLQTIFAN